MTTEHSNVDSIQSGLHKKSKVYFDVPWGPVAAIVVSIGVYFVSQILAVIIAATYPALKGWSETQINDWLATSTNAKFFVLLVAQLIAVALTVLFLRKRKAKLQDIGLKRPEIVDIGYALIGFVVYFIVLAIVLQVVAKVIPAIDFDQEQDIGFDRSVTGSSLGLIFMSLVILQPIVEEIVVRGFLFTGLRSKLKYLPAALLTSLIFGSAHLQAGNGTALLWVAAIDTFVLSMVMVYLREKTDSLAAPFLIHMVKNGIAFVFLFLVH